MKKTAIILGATGLTGSILLEKLLDDNRYKTIKLFSRKEIDGLPSKVKQFVGDILELEKFKKDFIANEVFCCILEFRLLPQNSQKQMEYLRF